MQSRQQTKCAKAAAAKAAPTKAAPTKAARKQAAASRDVTSPPNKPRWAHPKLRGWYDHGTFQSPVGDDQAVLQPDRPVEEDTWVRMLIIPPKFGERKLPGLWKDAELNRTRKGKCIMHGAMCTAKHNIPHAAKIIIKCFEEGIGNERDIVERDYNEALRKARLQELALKLNPETKKCYEQSMNGSTVTRLIGDGRGLEDQDLESLPVGCVYHSDFLEIMRTTLINLDRRDALTELHQFAKAHRSWAIGLWAGYKLKPTREDRAIFTEHMRRYHTFKLLWLGHMIWYDWQFFYAFPWLFQHLGVLRAIDQEPIESRQKMNSEMLTRSFRMANVSRLSLSPVLSVLSPLPSLLNLNRSDVCLTISRHRAKRLLSSFKRTRRSE